MLGQGFEPIALLFFFFLPGLFAQFQKWEKKFQGRGHGTVKDLLERMVTRPVCQNQANGLLGGKVSR